MLNVLVTGGAGYIGYSLVEKLEASDDVDRIYVLDNLVKGNHNFFLGGNKLRKTQFIKGEILDHHGLSKVLDKVQIVYHLAAHVSFPYSHEENLRYEQINQWGTSILSQEIAKYENIEKVIYLSSAAVYGQVESADIDTLPQPNNDYGRSKLEGEKMIRLLGPSKKVTIVRSANVFGYNPCIRLDAVLNQFIFKALTFGKVHIYGDGTQYRPFVSLDVLCDLLMDELRLDSQQETKNVVELSLIHI